MPYKIYNEISFTMIYNTVPHTVPTFNTLVYVTVKFYWRGGGLQNFTKMYTYTSERHRQYTGYNDKIVTPNCVPCNHLYQYCSGNILTTDTESETLSRFTRSRN